MEIARRRFVFESHVKQLKRLTLPSQRERVDRYVDRYNKGEKTLKRHPVLTFGHKLMEIAVKPKENDKVIVARELEYHEEDFLKSTGVVKMMFGRIRLVNASSKIGLLTGMAFLSYNLISRSMSGLILITSIAIGTLSFIGVRYCIKTIDKAEEIANEIGRIFESSTFAQIAIIDERRVGDRPN